jgi:hypothetical protein
VTGVPLGNLCSSSSSTPHSSSSSSSSSRCYVLDSEVHRGPRSAVWRATDSETHDPVVLKVREAHTLSRVVSFGICGESAN